MTPRATARRLRRHGKVVTATTAATALVGIAAASMGFAVGQDGSASAAPAPEPATAVPVVHHPTFAPAPPDLVGIGADIGQQIDRDVPSVPAAPSPTLPLVDVVDAIAPELPRLPHPVEGPDAGSGGSTATRTGPVPPLLSELLPPAVTGPVDQLLAPLPPTGADPILEAVLDPVLGAVDEHTCAIRQELEPVVDTLPRALVPIGLETCELDAPAGGAPSPALEPVDGIGAETGLPPVHRVLAEATPTVARPAGLLGG